MDFISSYSSDSDDSRPNEVSHTMNKQILDPGSHSSKRKIFKIESLDDECEWTAKSYSMSKETASSSLSKDKMTLSQMLPPPKRCIASTSKPKSAQGDLFAKADQKSKPAAKPFGNPNLSLENHSDSIEKYPEAPLKSKCLSQPSDTSNSAASFIEISQKDQLHLSLSEKIAFSEHLSSIKMALEEKPGSIVEASHKIRNQHYLDQEKEQRRSSKFRYGF